jgi:hypothetical protein
MRGMYENNFSLCQTPGILLNSEVEQLHNLSKVNFIFIFSRVNFVLNWNHSQ